MNKKTLKVTSLAIVTILTSILIYLTINTSIEESLNIQVSYAGEPVYELSTSYSITNQSQIPSQIDNRIYKFNDVLIEDNFHELDEAEITKIQMKPFDSILNWKDENLSLFEMNNSNLNTIKFPRRFYPSKYFDAIGVGVSNEQIAQLNLIERSSTKSYLKYNDKLIINRYNVLELLKENTGNDTFFINYDRYSLNLLNPITSQEYEIYDNQDIELQIESGNIFISNSTKDNTLYLLNDFTLLQSLSINYNIKSIELQITNIDQGYYYQNDEQYSYLIPILNLEILVPELEFTFHGYIPLIKSDS